MKTFVDKNGNNIHESFPLRYKNELFQSVLETLSEPVPADDELDELHEWNLKTPKGIRLLTRYIWEDASEDQKEKASHGELHRVYSPSLFGVCFFRDGTFCRKVGLARLKNIGTDCS